jgi:hypothetical protein
VHTVMSTVSIKGGKFNWLSDPNMSLLHGISNNVKTTCRNLVMCDTVHVKRITEYYYNY